MSLNIDSKLPIHYPKKSVFEFDEEVSSIFPDMAARSIPMYNEVHRMHAAMVLSSYATVADVIKITDVGASRGKFYQEICNQLHSVKDTNKKPTIEYTAMDTSPDMVRLLRRDFPEISVVELTESNAPEELKEKQDVIVMFYTLQFMRVADRRRLMQWVWRNLRYGGLFIFGNKIAQSDGLVGIYENREYINFRLANGYSIEEIEAKTEALRNVMWPLSKNAMRDTLRSLGFYDVTETTKWLQFSTGVAVK